MSENGWIVLIIAAAVVVIIFLLRERLSRFLFKGGGIETEIETHADGRAGGDSSANQSDSVSVRDNRLSGEGNRVDIERDSVAVEENKLKGKGNVISVKSDTSKKK